MMNSRSRRSMTVALSLAALALGSCSAFERDESGRIPLDPDLRGHARRARANLARLLPERRAAVEPILEKHERAIHEYDRLMAKGRTRRAMQGPLYGAGAYVIANDVSGAGVADDVAIPFLALGAVALVLATTAPASSSALQRALDDVKDSAKNVSGVFSRVEESDKPIAPPGTRDHCIDMYVDCQLNARRGFRGCQACMDWCMGAPYKWPDKKACDYTRSFLKDMPPVRIKM